MPPVRLQALQLSRGWGAGWVTDRAQDLGVQRIFCQRASTCLTRSVSSSVPPTPLGLVSPYREPQKSCIYLSGWLGDGEGAMCISGGTWCVFPVWCCRGTPILCYALSCAWGPVRIRSWRDDSPSPRYSISSTTPLSPSRPYSISSCINTRDVVAEGSAPAYLPVPPLPKPPQSPHTAPLPPDVQYLH